MYCRYFTVTLTAVIPENSVDRDLLITRRPSRSEHKRHYWNPITIRPAQWHV